MHPQPHDELQLRDLHSFQHRNPVFAEDLLIKTLENPSWEKTFRKPTLLKAKKLTG